MPTTTAVRGTFFDLLDDPWKHVGREQESAGFVGDGLLMEACVRLKREHPDCWINTHISENPNEVRQAQLEYPD